MAKEKRKKGKLTGILRMPKGSDKILHFTVLVLVLFGSVMIVDINVGQTSSNNMVVITTAVKQGLFMIAGYVAMLFAAKVFEFNWFYRLSKVIIIAMTVLLILPFFSIEQGGSNAWIYITIGSQVISLQPSEFVKPLMIVLIATYVYAAQHHKGMQKSAWKMLRVPIICFVLFSVIILAQRDIGALAILFLICAGAIQPVAYPKLRKLQVAARAAVLIDEASGRLLYGYNEHRQLPSVCRSWKRWRICRCSGISPLVSSMPRTRPRSICTAEAISLRMRFTPSPAQASSGWGLATLPGSMVI